MENDFSSLKAGDTVGVVLITHLGNAYRRYRVPYVSATVKAVGRKWITVLTERGCEWRFDKDGIPEDLNEGIRLEPSVEQAEKAVKKSQMVKEIVGLRSGYLLDMPFETIENAYRLLVGEKEKK